MKSHCEFRIEEGLWNTKDKKVCLHIHVLYKASASGLFTIVIVYMSS